MRLNFHILLLVSIMLPLASCKQPQQLDLRSFSGKASPYQNVKKVYFLPEVDFGGCDTEGQKIPDFATPERLMTIVTERAYVSGTFNHTSDGKFRKLPSNSIQVGSAPKMLDVEDLLVRVHFDYDCRKLPPNLSFYWETERHSSTNTYVRKSNDHWYSPNHPGESKNVPLSISEADFFALIKANQFRRYEIDSCGVVTSGMPPPKNIERVKCL